MNAFSDPQKIINSLDIFSGQQIADLGSGSGVYSLALAEKTRGGNSKVYAVDVQKDLLERLDAEAKSRGLTSLHIIWGNIELDKGTRLRHESIDTVLIANTLFQSEHKKEIITEAHRILKTEGRLIVIDWSQSFGNIGPKPESIISMSSAQTLCTQNGFTKDREFDAGEHHYGFIMHKN